MLAVDFVTHPLLYALILSGGVGLGLPMGAAVVAAGGMFGGTVGLLVVLAGQVIGLVINWNLCRHWCRAWIVHRVQRQRNRKWLLRLVDTRLSWHLMVLMRLALLPMALVSACCALSATDWRAYSLASTLLVLRFTLMVQVGARTGELFSGQLSTGATAITGVAITATAALAWMSSVQLRQRLRRIGS